MSARLTMLVISVSEFIPDTFNITDILTNVQPVLHSLRLGNSQNCHFGANEVFWI